MHSSYQNKEDEGTDSIPRAYARGVAGVCLKAEALNHAGLRIEDVAKRIRESAARVATLDGEYLDGTAADLIESLRGSGKKFVVITGNDGVVQNVRTRFPQVPILVKGGTNNTDIVTAVQGFMATA